MSSRLGTAMSNDGRNEIRVNNSAGKCLLENWVEERVNNERDPPLDRVLNIQERADYFVRGHKGLITIDGEAKVESLSEVRASYTQQFPDPTRRVGKRKELMEQAFAEAVCEDMLKEKEEKKKANMEGIMCSTFTKDYSKEFVKIVPKQTKDHDYVNEQPVTFWSEHRDKIHGTTQVKTRDTVFRKNDAFSKPIGESWDQPKPLEQDPYPMM